MSVTRSLPEVRGTPSTLDVSGADSVAELIEDFVTGQRDLTGLELYLELERRSALLQFHTTCAKAPAIERMMVSSSRTAITIAC